MHLGPFACFEKSEAVIILIRGPDWIRGQKNTIDVKSSQKFSDPLTFWSDRRSTAAVANFKNKNWRHFQKKVALKVSEEIENEFLVKKNSEFIQEAS